jgi:hypothetical protein
MKQIAIKRMKTKYDMKNWWMKLKKKILIL